MVRVALRFAKDEMCNEDEKRFKKVDGRAACIAYVGEVQACSHRQQLQLMLKQEVRPLAKYIGVHMQDSLEQVMLHMQDRRRVQSGAALRIV